MSKLFISEVPTLLILQRRGASKRRSDSICKQLDLFVKVMLLEETPAVLSLGKLCGIMGIRSTGPAVENHISSEVARKLNAKNPTMYHLCFLDCQRVLPHLQLHPPPLHHLLHRSHYRRSEKTEMLKLQYRKGVEVRMESSGETAARIHRK